VQTITTTIRRGGLHSASAQGRASHNTHTQRPGPHRRASRQLSPAFGQKRRLAVRQQRGKAGQESTARRPGFEGDAPWKAALQASAAMAG